MRTFTPCHWHSVDLRGLRRRRPLRLAFAAVCGVAVLGCAGASPDATAPSTVPPASEPSSSPPAPPDAPVSPEVAKGVAALEANDLATAKTHFQAALAANGSDADALYYLGALSEKAGDMAGAEASYKAALRARPDSLMAAQNLSALYDDAQRFDEALAIVSPSLTTHATDGTLHLNAGIAHAGKKEADAAIREFDAAIAAAPSDATYRLVYAHWLGALGQRDTAVKMLGAALPMAHGNVGVVAALAHELHVLAAFPECVAAFTRAVALNPAAEILTERAACKIGQKDDAGALDDLRSATAKDSKYAPAQYYLGNELAKAGHYGPALAAYQAFLRLEPNGPLAKGVAEKIRLAKQHLGQ